MEEKKQDIEYSKKVEKLKKDISREDIEIIRGCIHNELLDRFMGPYRELIVEENLTDEVIKDAFFACEDVQILIMAMRMGLGEYKTQKYTYKKIKEDLALGVRVCDLYSEVGRVTCEIIRNIIDEKKSVDLKESFKKWDSSDYYNKWRKFVAGPKANITKKEWREFQHNAKRPHKHWAFYRDDWHPDDLGNNYNELCNDIYKRGKEYQTGPKDDEYISLCIKSSKYIRGQVMLRMRYGLMKYHRMKCGEDELRSLFDENYQRMKLAESKVLRWIRYCFVRRESVEELQSLIRRREEERIACAKEGNLLLEDMIIWWTDFYDCLDENNMPTQDRLMEEFRKYLLVNKKIPDEIISKIISVIDDKLNRYYKFALYKRCGKIEEFKEEERLEKFKKEELDEVFEELDEVSEENSEDDCYDWADEEDDWDYSL